MNHPHCFFGLHHEPQNPVESEILYSINCLAILPLGHSAYSAQFLPGIRDILRGMLGASLLGNGLERVLGPDDLPSDRRRLHLLRPQTCSITIPKALTEVTRLAWYCLGCVHVLGSTVSKDMGLSATREVCRLVLPGHTHNCTNVHYTESGNIIIGRFTTGHFSNPF